MRGGGGRWERSEGHPPTELLPLYISKLSWGTQSVYAWPNSRMMGDILLCAFPALSTLKGGARGCTWTQRGTQGPAVC